MHDIIMDRDDSGSGGSGKGPPDLLATKVLGEPAGDPANPFAATMPAHPPPAAHPFAPVPPTLPVGPNASPPSPYAPNPFPHPNAGVNPFAPVPPTMPVGPNASPPNPYVPSPFPHPNAGVNPFAPVPPTLPVAYPPPHAYPPPAGVNPFAPAPPIDDARPINPFAQPVNPFAPSNPAYADPYRAQAPHPQQPMPHHAPHPMAGVQPIANTRPLTIAVAAASGLYVIALLYATFVASQFKVVTITSYSQLGRLDEATRGLKSAELFHFFAVIAVAGTVIPWWILAGQNCRKLCADKPRFSPWNAFAFLGPGLNMLVVGNAFEDLGKHSSERRGKVPSIARIFRIAVLVPLGARILLLLAATRELTQMGGPMDAVFYVYGFGDPARFAYQAGPSYQGAIVAVSLLGLAAPVLGVLTCFKIERLQREAHRRLRASVI